LVTKWQFGIFPRFGILYISRKIWQFWNILPRSGIFYHEKSGNPELPTQALTLPLKKQLLPWGAVVEE
jgi:hypothetical protein